MKSFKLLLVLTSLFITNSVLAETIGGPSLKNLKRMSNLDHYSFNVTDCAG